MTVGGDVALDDGECPGFPAAHRLVVGREQGICQRSADAAIARAAPDAVAVHLFQRAFKCLGQLALGFLAEVFVVAEEIGNVDGSRRQGEGATAALASLPLEHETGQGFRQTLDVIRDQSPLVEGFPCDGPSRRLVAF
jgi:hypothetical protein